MPGNTPTGVGSFRRVRQYFDAARRFWPRYPTAARQDVSRKIVIARRGFARTLRAASSRRRSGAAAASCSVTQQASCREAWNTRLASEDSYVPSMDYGFFDDDGDRRRGYVRAAWLQQPRNKLRNEY